MCVCVRVHVFLEMDKLNGEADDSKGCGDVIKAVFRPNDLSETELSMPEGQCYSHNSSKTKDEDFLIPHLEQFHSSNEATSSNTTVDDATAAYEASDAVDSTDANEIRSPHRDDENVPSDCVEDDTSRPVESVGELDERSEPTNVHETQPVAATNEDADWMYILGHDQLKKRACILRILALFLFAVDANYSIYQTRW